MSPTAVSHLQVPTYFGEKYLIVGVPKDILRGRPENYPRIPVRLEEKDGLIAVSIITPRPVGIYLYGCFGWQPQELESKRSTQPITALNLRPKTGELTVQFDQQEFTPPSHNVWAYDVESKQSGTTSMEQQIANGIMALKKQSVALGLLKDGFDSPDTSA